MSDYESIHGRRVNYLSSDPTLNSSTEGQVWYNSNSGANKALVQIKAWSSGANTPTNFVFSGGVGGQTDTLGFGGVGPSPQPAHNLTIEYSGFTWTGLPNLNTNRRAGYAFGTSTSAVYAGGDYAPGSPTLTQATEEWNGSSWTSVTNMPNNQGSFGASSGTLTAGLVYGGYGNPQSTSTKTVSYDGTNWTDLPSPGADTNVSGNFTLGGGGTQTAAIFSGGSPYTGSRGTSTETFDGSSWTSQNNMNTGRGAQGLLGTQTNALYAGGRGPSPSRTGATEEWDSSTWTTSSASLSTARSGCITSKGGSTTAAVIGAGTTGSNTNATEEYNSNINALTAAAWSSGGAMSTSRAQFGSAKHGTQSAGLAFGGFNWPSTNRSETEEYGGSSWTSGGALPAGQRQMGGTGTQTAALGYGGLTGIPNTTTLEYDGSSWTSGGTLPAGIRYAVNSAAGTQTAALRAGSTDTATQSTTTQEYDGSSWSSANAMSVARSSASFDGAQTAAIITAGEAPGAPDVNGGVTKLTEEYDGTNWTSGTSSLLYLASQGVSGGSAAPTAFMTVGGDGPNVTNNTGATQEYDGTSFASTANLANPRRQLNGGGTQSAGLVFGGSEASTTAMTNTEEYTGTTSTITASTLTSS